MASSSEARRLTEQHRLEQQQVRAGFLAEFVALWTLLDTARLDETAPGWVQAVMRLVRIYRLRSAQSAVSYFVAYRDAEVPPVLGREPIIELPRTLIVPDVADTPIAPAREETPRQSGRARSSGRAQVVPARTPKSGGAARSRVVPRGETTPTLAPSRRDTPPDRRSDRREDRGEDRRARIEFPDIPQGRTERRTRIVMPDLNFERDDRATKVSLEVTGPIAQKDKIRRGKPARVAQDESFVHAAGAASRHVLTGGRQSLLTLVDADSQALGWARVTDGDPCAFCAMLASRGPVYGSAAAAGFSAHDACACTAEPVYSRSAPWPGRAREFQRLWRETTQNTSGRDSINAFRRAYEQMQRDQRRGNVA